MAGFTADGANVIVGWKNSIMILFKIKVEIRTYTHTYVMESGQSIINGLKH